MHRFIAFNDEKADTLLMLELTDLAKTLTKSALYEAEIRAHSYLSKREQKVFVSHFWNHRPDWIKKSGMKSDVYLRALGNMNFTDFQDVELFRDIISASLIPRFAGQLFILAEDLRIEELCKKERPGMAFEFKVRRKIYKEYFESQLVVNLERNLFIDALFNLIYLSLNSDSPILTMPSFNSEIDEGIPLIRSELENFYDTQSTQVVADACLKIVERVGQLVNTDMINDYYHLPGQEQNLLDVMSYSDLLRKDSLQNDDTTEEKAGGDEQVHEEEMRTWHRETESPGKSFMQFNLDQGTRTDIAGGSEREGEEGDQALGIVQGRSVQTDKKEYDGMELTSMGELDASNGKNKYGTSNKNARSVFLKAGRPDKEALAEYGKLEKEVKFYHKKLKNIIQRVMEKKETDHRSHLQMGQLGKNLLPFFTDENPKLFYKKAEPSKEIDASFILLVDCSASMFDKMEETRRGIILFHEALKSVDVPHEIIGFWEDANESAEDDQPNYFFQVIPFSMSLQHKTGPEIMELEAMEDNRDGYAIRIAAERLLERKEKQKFLIIFSDGEPAAYDYNNGIVDTHEAVMEVRQKGIEIFNIFLSTSGLEFEQKKVFETIYGNRSIIAPYVEELPNVLFPLLKKILTNSINM
ncbi:vWA domain-containing protein [Bacillus norwichensis]|uniref:VWFA domain-containing protein n=1 Tax=Bacillus norwichensis TaxID=2762217 RepID=A0ABR8VJR0_9BACI|nr:hypothetical protein [Bacillus norwichensis]MBD8004989.1 hypothetical protein [Bacillus norwichensis]